MILPLTSLTNEQAAYLNRAAIERDQSNAEYALALFKRALEREMKSGDYWGPLHKGSGRMSFSMVEDE